MSPIRFGILISSDRSSRNERADGTTPLLTQKIEELGWIVEKSAIVPDEVDDIKSILITWADQNHLDVILTSGGTGFAPRDVTPEATLAVIERLTPGISEAMHAKSLQITAHAMLSRAVAGIRKSTLIVNLPGSPKGALENFLIVAPVLTHAVELLNDSPSSEAGHQIPH